MKSPRGSFILADILELSVLPRLPVKSLVRFKCVCRRWYALISGNQFFIMQQYEKCTSLQSLNVGVRWPWHSLSIGKYGNPVCFADLLPHTKEYEILASCNGLVAMACRLEQAGSPVISHGHIANIVVGNPVYQDWKGILPPVFLYLHFGLGLAYDPTRSVASYKLVFYKPISRGNNQKDHGFYIFSSETGSWKVSKSEIRVPSPQVFWINSVAFLSGILYWVVTNFRIMWYDTTKDCSGLVPMPACKEGTFDFGTLNESNGSITYTRVTAEFEMEVWTMKDFQWYKIYDIRIHLILHQIQYHADLWVNESYSGDDLRRPRAFSLGFDGKEAFFVLDMTPFSYNAETGAAIQYSTLGFMPNYYFMYKASLIPTPGQQRQQLFPPIMNRLKPNREGYICLEYSPAPDVFNVKKPDLD